VTNPLAPEAAPRAFAHGRPGDPREMSSELRLALEPLLTGEGLIVHQDVEWSQVLIGWNAANHYAVRDLSNRLVLYVGEAGEGWGSALARNFWPFREMRLELMTPGGIVALVVRRRWRLWLARIEVVAWDGRILGVIQQRWRWFRRQFDVLDPQGETLASIEGGFWRPWTYPVTARGVEVAVIRKRWSGLAREFFTNADEFGIELRPMLTDGCLRQMLLAATLAIDLVAYEDRQRKGLLGTLGDD
jgi:hypothetical protein